jgi:hypothetical protein
MKDLATGFEPQAGDRRFNLAGAHALPNRFSNSRRLTFSSPHEIQTENLAKANLIDASTRLDLLSNASQDSRTTDPLS